jgi:Putative Flp pilus-assembly TadE/G-like
MNRRKQSGQVLVGMAVAFVVLAGFAGLAIDMGTLRYQRRLQQSAADSAAIAAASNLTYSGYLTAAQNSAAENGFTDGGSQSLSGCEGTAAVGTTCVEVHNGPIDVTFNGNTISAGSHPNNTDYVEVLIAKVHPTFFMTIFGVNSKAVVARAVATNTGGGPTGGAGCIYTLGTPSKVLNFNKAGVGSTGTNYIYAPTCGITDNGNLVANGNISLKAASIGVGGSINLPNNSTPDCTADHPAGVCPTPVAGMPYSGDPFASKYPVPSVVTAGTSSTTNGVTTYTPGVYSDLTVNNTTNAVFEPGVYEMTGAFRINGGANVCGGGSATFSGGTMTCSYAGGVTFYVTGSGSVSVNGTSNTQMYAPNSGTYEGLLFYQDPLDTQQATINGTDNSFFQGLIYMPSADLDFSGTADFNNGAAYTVIVADQLLVSGGAYVNLKSDYSSLSGGGPLVGALKWAILVE